MYFRSAPCELPKRESPAGGVPHAPSSNAVHCACRPPRRSSTRPLRGRTEWRPGYPGACGGFRYPKIDIHPFEKGWNSDLVATVTFTSGYASFRARSAWGNIATSPIAEVRITSRCRGSFLFFRGIKHGIERRIVIHLHLFVGLHVFTSGFNILDQLLDRSRKINLLRQQHIEFCWQAARCASSTSLRSTS